MKEISSAKATPIPRMRGRILPHDRAPQRLNIVEAAKSKRRLDSLDEQNRNDSGDSKKEGRQRVFHGIGGRFAAFLRHTEYDESLQQRLRTFGEACPTRAVTQRRALLARYVRDLKVLRLEDAVRR